MNSQVVAFNSHLPHYGRNVGRDEQAEENYRAKHTVPPRQWTSLHDIERNTAGGNDLRIAEDARIALYEALETLPRKEWGSTLRRTGPPALVIRYVEDRLPRSEYDFEDDQSEADTPEQASRYVARYGPGCPMIRLNAGCWGPTSPQLSPAADDESYGSEASDESEASDLSTSPSKIRLPSKRSNSEEF